MVRRISTTIAALAIALLIYAVFTSLIIHRISTKLIGPSVRRPPCTCQYCQANRSLPSVPVFGARVPLSCVVAACVTGLAMPLVAECMTRLRRRRRYLNDECIDCGYPITKWRGHCPGCGVRIGPG